MSSTSSKTTTSRSDLIILGLGSNAGASREILCWAAEELERFLGPLRVAPLYRSAPLSPIAQPDFFNAVAVGTLRRPRSGAPGTPGPEDVMAFAKALELAAGRRRGARLGPRPLDVDLLLHGERRSQRPELTLPHPRLLERRFVLAPLSDLCPDLEIEGRTVSELADRLAGEQRVDRA
jgi:2-amino-4-hydroxy-6-hydroxymethyldihydropteridine diphosphokinase